MMINKFKTLRGCQLDGLDGEIGAVREFYFDDLDWAIRYLVADTGDWLKGRQVLISPNALARAIQDARPIAIGLTQEQIENSPLLNIDMPVSRQFEEAYYGYYGWPAYWSGSPLWGTDTERGCERENRRKSTQGTTTPDELHLHITADIWSCHIHDGNGEIGNVDDLIIDDETWTIRFFIINTQTWWPGKKVLVAPQWITCVDWGDSKVLINLPNEIPEFDEGRHNHHMPRFHLQECNPWQR
ncbi:MAG: PRC-barrel domain-containing protein [Verrucomicrobia bacterium]|nr:PRC-barrel domain-containing protein [Verrucomicrobiota bacterium]